MSEREVGEVICAECGQKYGRVRNEICTLWMGDCDYCGKHAPVTSPRNYGWPALPEKVSKQTSE